MKHRGTPMHIFLRVKCDFLFRDKFKNSISSFAENGDKRNFHEATNNFITFIEMWKKVFGNFI